MKKPARFVGAVILTVLFSFIASYPAFSASLELDPETGIIQEAVDQAQAGDVILLLPGVYGGQGNRDIDFGGKDLVIMAKSSGAPYDTVIDCQNLGRALYLHSGETSASMIVNVTIRNGQAAGGAGGAVLCSTGASPVIYNCVIENSSADNGGGIAVDAASPSIENCLIKGNHALDGGAMYITGASLPKITNCTITGNTADHKAGIYEDEPSAPAIVNSIIIDNVSANNEKDSLSSVSYSCIKDADAAGVSNIKTDAVFAAGPDGNYYLNVTSPLIDAGIASTEPYGTTAVDETPDAGTVDMGFHYNAAGSILIPQFRYVPDEYPTIQSAVNSAVNGDTIYVRAGTYRESVKIEGKTLVITGEDSANTFIDAQGLGRGLHISNNTDVTIADLTIKNAVSYNIYIGPWSYYTTTIVRLDHVILEGSNSGIGGTLMNGTQGDLRASYVTIENSKIRRAASCGVNLAFDPPARWMTNIIKPPSGYEIVIANSEITNNGKGIAVSGYRKDVNITHSVVAYNKNEGVRLYSDGNPTSLLTTTMKYNIVAFNTKQGVWVGTTPRLTLDDNVLYGNSPDVYPYTYRGLSPSVENIEPVNQDPKFVNAAVYDFSVQPDSPALKVNTPSLGEDCGVVQ